MLLVSLHSGGHRSCPAPPYPRGIRLQGNPAGALHATLTAVLPLGFSRLSRSDTHLKGEMILSSQNGNILKHRSRFQVSAMGPQGGSVYKSGISRSETFLRHDNFPVHVEVEGFLVDGDPHVRVRAWKLVNRSASDSSQRTQERVFYEGPLSAICGGRDTLKQQCDTVDPDDEVCTDCSGVGWAIFNEEEPDTPGDVQRCDTCRILPNDNAAWKAAAQAGYLVDADGNIIRKEER